MIGIRKKIGQQKSNDASAKRKWQLELEENKTNDKVELANLESIQIPKSESDEEDNNVNKMIVRYYLLFLLKLIKGFARSTNY